MSKIRKEQTDFNVTSIVTKQQEIIGITKQLREELDIMYAKVMDRMRIYDAFTDIRVTPDSVFVDSLNKIMITDYFKNCKVIDVTWYGLVSETDDEPIEVMVGCDVDGYQQKKIEHVPIYVVDTDLSDDEFFACLVEHFNKRKESAIEFVEAEKMEEKERRRQQYEKLRKEFEGEI